MTENTHRDHRGTQALIRLMIMAAILICVNILASYFHTGLDLTKEKRFTLTDPTRKLLREMKEVAVIDVYLDGKFPADLQRMQEAVRERLRSFKEIAGNNIIYRFIDPIKGKNKSEQQQVARDLQQKGISYILLDKSDDEDEMYSSKLCFPFALVHYNGKEMPVRLLDNPPGKTPSEKISYAESNLEYKFANAINQLNRPDVARVGYLVGNGEELGLQTLDMLYSLSQIYKLDTVDLAHVLTLSLAYDAMIIAQPTIPFTGPEKFKIDQYIMHGGHVLWLVNTMNASLDSFKNSPQFISTEYGLDLDNLLFKYGVRVNNDLVEDMQCIPMPRTLDGKTLDLRPWIFFPKLNPTADHPIVRNMDFVMAGFTNSIDTIRASGIKKTVLLQTSKYSLASRSPVRVSLSTMSYPLRNEMFTKSYLPVAVLLEGKFVSAYKGVLAPEFFKYMDAVHVKLKPSCDTDNSMIVVSAGELFSNGYTAKDGVLPIGYYKFTGEYFANRDFLLNCMEYLTDHSGILEARSKDVKLRMLDSGRAKEEKTMWQFVNVGIPIAIVLIFASIYSFVRMRRYDKRSN